MLIEIRNNLRSNKKTGRISGNFSPTPSSQNADKTDEDGFAQMLIEIRNNPRRPRSNKKTGRISGNFSPKNPPGFLKASIFTLLPARRF